MAQELKEGFCDPSALWTGLEGFILSDLERKALEDFQPAGVLLYERNCCSFEQIQALIQEVKSLSSQTLVGIDEEGGRVSRLPKPFPQFPFLSEILKREKDEAFCKIQDQIRQTASFLKHLGFDLVFAPVVDLKTSQTASFLSARCFSHDADLVQEVAHLVISTYKKFQIKCCLKHFPGHGRASEDSHLICSSVSASLEELWNFDWKPYRFLCPLVDYVMTAHLMFPFFDQVPATLSSSLLTYLKDFSFQGKIIADDLYMSGLLSFYGYEKNWVQIFEELPAPEQEAPAQLAQAYQDACKAGCDEVILSRPFKYHAHFFQKDLV